MTKQTSREKFEAIVKGDPRQNNQVLKRSELLPEIYQYDSINFAYKCFCIAESSNQSEIAALREENKRLKGIKPELPPRPPESGEMKRYGLRWNSPTEPLAVLMDDGYWTPWHIANNELEQVKKERDDLLNTLHYTSDYLDENKLNSIGHGSKAHNEMRAAIKAAKGKASD